MAKESNLPSIKETAFDCPHCGAFTTQQWLRLSATYLDEKQRTPNIPDKEMMQRVQESPMNDEMKANFISYIGKMDSGLIFLDRHEEGRYIYNDVCNLYLSHCYNCKKFAVWVHDRLVHPMAQIGPSPNPDLPSDALRDYEEAGRIVGESPRGAAALLRLTIQKLCVVLGEKGKSIDDDIASLVKKGLAPLVQQALDAVRVIGNEAVHPGSLDLKDDRDTAMRLFGLVNIIAEQMISNPKHVRELYEKIPDGKRTAIEKRDAKT